MPSKDAHVAAAKRNQEAIVAFYKALHIIEAVLASDAGPVKHTDDHKVRNLLLKTTKRYEQLWRMYRPLWEASLIARYLRVSETSPVYELFDNYMSPEVVKGQVLNHFLVQVEKSAGKLIGDPDFLRH